MTTFPEDRRYFEQYKLNRVVTRSQTPHNQAWWPEGSDPGGANAGIPPNQVESSGEGERLSRKRSSSTSSAELRDDNTSVKHQKYDAEEAAKEVEKHIPLDRKTASHDAQLKRLENAQASKRSRTRLKTMKEQLDESEKARKLAEETIRQEREQHAAELRQIRQQLENKR
ncbi:hypothetical protein E4U11_000696 [Claviceps purpurea]|nr:hypothetical protein E4U11_000696 [Claviceps purpurea]